MNKDRSLDAQPPRNVSDDSYVSLSQIVEESMVQMGLDPKNPKDIQEFWQKKGLVE